MDNSLLLPWQQFAPYFGARFSTKAEDYKLRPNEELADRLCTKLLQSNFERDIKELSIGCRQLPWMIWLTSLSGQFHPGSYARSLFYLMRDELKRQDQPDKADRLFVRLQLNRLLYPQKSGRTVYRIQKMMSSKQYHSDSQTDETNRRKKAWVLYDQSLDSLSALQLPERKGWQPFLITIGFVPEAIKPIESK